jgi:hypothetical protein
MADVKGRNVVTKIENGKLLIEIDLNAKGEISKSGMSQVIATTQGNKVVAHQNKAFKLSVNLFTA